MQAIRIVLISAPHVQGLGLRKLLQQQHGARLLQATSTSAEAIAIVGRERPDIVVVVADLPVSPLIALIERLRDASSESRVVLVGHVRRRTEHVTLLEAGIACYLGWEDVTAEQIRRVTETVHETRLWIASGAVVDAMVRRVGASGGPELTPREHTVLEHLANGLTRPQIAQAEHLSERTLRRTIDALKEKFAAPSTFMLGVQAERMGCLDER